MTRCSGADVVAIEILPQLREDLFAFFATACRHQHNDLVAAHAGHTVHRAHAFLAQERHGLEELIPDKMPHIVFASFNPLTLQEITHNGRNPFVLDVRQLDVKIRPTVQARQRVALGELLKIVSVRL